MHKKHIDLVEEKILPLAKLEKLVHMWRLRGDKIVFTNGCFDILHRGHLEYLAASADLGNRMVVGLNSDSSVTKLKGTGRPVNCFADRALALAALRFTDAVVEFDEDTPLELIKTLLPEVLVKGGDYTHENIVGAKEVEAIGGKVAIISFTEGYSTTSFLEKLRG
jgi:rfaE bifunctional protein nucleotidyltransferase chain/domain